MVDYRKTIQSIIRSEEEWNQNPQAVWGLATGFESFDVGLGGLHGGELSILAARPGNGKSTLANQIAFNIANRNEKHHRQTGEDVGTVILFSPEMSLRAIIIREACAISAVPSRALKTGTATPEERERFHRALARLEELGDYIFISAGADTRLSDIESVVGQMNERVELVILDYLTLLIPESARRGQDWLEVGEWVRRLKVLAQTYDIPIMVLSQLSRDVEKDAGDDDVERPPKLSDLRRSGEIEQHADAVFLLSRQRERVNQGDRGVAAMLDIAKNRDGPTGYINLYFNVAYNKFTDPGPRTALHLEGV